MWKGFIDVWRLHSPMQLSGEVNRRDLCISETSVDIFGGFKIVKGSVVYYVLLTWSFNSCKMPYHALPDSAFHKFRASRSGDRLILCSSKKSSDGFWRSNIVIGSVGCTERAVTKTRALDLWIENSFFISCSKVGPRPGQLSAASVL